jgi:tetratricopeptide (TPR) repeat protein
MRNVCLLAVAGLSLLLQRASVSGHEGLHELIDAQKKKVEKAPSDPAVHFELANLYGMHRELKLALLELERVDALAPGQFVTDFWRGQFLFGAGEFTEAREALDRQLFSHPELARAWLLRAEVQQKLGRDQASLADYREALSRTPSPEPDLYQEVTDALAAHGYEKDAIEILTAAIQRLGKIPSLVLRALDIEIKTKNFNAALVRIEDSRRDAPRPEPWMARRATVLAQAGRIDESRAAWQALAKHLESLPDPERKSSAMTVLNDEARQALNSLKPVSESASR